MKAYYNEHDRQAAAWIRELIKDGLIAPGDVDERSIEDIVPNELRGYTQHHFFAGIAVWSYALRRAGWPDNRRIITGSCPCQPFSAAGKGEGFDDERHLWPAWFHIIHALQGYDEFRGVPIFGEQVSSKDGQSWIDLVSDDLEGIGYTIRALDIPACSVGAPHRRNRFYFVADAGRGRRQQLSEITSIGREADGEAEPDVEFSDRRPSRLLADPNGRHESDGELQRSGEHGQQPQDGGVGQLADTLPAGRTEGWPESGNGQIAGSCGFSGLDNASDARCNNAGQHGSRSPLQPARSIESSTSGELGNAVEQRLEGHSRNERDGNEPGRLYQNSSRPVTEAGPTNGFWRDAEWIYCRDEKYRAVESGTFPLASGAPARVGRVRGYGNSIVAPLAEEFVKTYLEEIDA